MQRKKGISLIVLVISIIVMIILASAIILSLSNTGIFDKAQEAVDASDLKEVQSYAATVWAEAYLNGARTQEALKAAVTEGLQDIKNISDYLVRVTEEGVEVAIASKTLGGLIKSAADYGKTVDYSVTVGETTYDDWQIYYNNDDYVFLIAEGSIGNIALGAANNLYDAYTAYGNVSDLTKEQLSLYKKFKLGQDGYVLDAANASSNAVAYLLTDFANFANTTASYASYVEGAIGGPTIELMCAGWNAFNAAKKVEDSTHTYTALTPSSDVSWKGYKVNDTTSVDLVTIDGWDANGDAIYGSSPDEGLYVPNTQGAQYWLASPQYFQQDDSSGSIECIMLAYEGGLTAAAGWVEVGVRPVVCLKSSIPAKVNGDIGFTLEK